MRAKQTKEGTKTRHVHKIRHDWAIEKAEPNLPLVCQSTVCEIEQDKFITDLLI